MKPHILSSVRGRIISGIVLMVVILVAFAASSAWLTYKHRSTTATLEQKAEITFLVLDAKANSELAASSVQRYVIVGDDVVIPGNDDILLSLIEESTTAAIDDLTQAIVLEKALGDEEDVTTLVEILAEGTALVQGSSQIVTLRQAGELEAVSAAFEKIVPEFRVFESKLKQAAEKERTEASAFRADAEQAGTLALWILIISASAGAVLTLAGATLIARSIIGPLSRVERTAIAVADGDLQARSPETGPDELVRLSRSINSMTESLLDASKRRELEQAREQAYVALKESEEKWQSLVKNTSDIVSILDSQGITRVVSPSVTGLMGYSPDELVGKSAFTLIHPDDTPAIARVFAELISGDAESHQMEFRYRQKDGRYRTLGATGSVLTNENGIATGVIAISRDITELREMTRRLEFQAHLLATVGDAIVATDLGGGVVFWNAAAERLYGWTAQEALGRSVQKLLRMPEGHDGLTGAIARVAGGASFSVEFETSTKFGERIPVEVAMSPFRDVNGRIIGAICDSHDISERKKSEAIIRHMAYHDSLTDLPNRTLFTDRLNIALANARRAGQMVAVLFLDLDQFKAVNDSVGHGLGDELLRRVGERLSALVRDGDTVARTGGDEFTLLLPNLTRTQDVVDVASRIIETFRIPWSVGGHEFRVTASIGIAVSPGDGDDADLLVRNADMAMYRVKGQGRNNYKFYATEMSAGVSRPVDP